MDKDLNHLLVRRADLKMELSLIKGLISAVEVEIHRARARKKNRLTFI